jgi:glucose/arabinose dehydrogenase
MLKGIHMAHTSVLRSCGFTIAALIFASQFFAPAVRVSTLHAPGSAQAIIQLQPVLSGLSSPVYVTSARDGTNRLFIVEQGGVIKVLQPGSSTPTVFLNITSQVLSGGERGLLGLAFHPAYKTNGRFFVYYTRQTDGALRIAEYHVSTNHNAADTTETIILEIPHPTNTNHNGGTLQFGPDGYLYAAPGDGGSGNDPPNNAQNINVLLGKVLRIDIDHQNGAVPYSSPSTNPFFGATAGADEIYAVGMRNPYRFSFDRATGQLYVGDVGQDRWEEIDIVTLGGNYGWRVFEGSHCTGNDPGICSAGSTNCNINGYTCPIAEYSSANPDPRCAITGGYVYRGPLRTVPTGAYVYGDYCTGEIFMLNGGSQTLLLDTSRNISSFGEDEDGELYVVGLGGTLERIASTTPSTLSINAVASPAGRTAGNQQIKLTGAFANLASVLVGGVSASWSYTNGAGDTSMITVTTPAHDAGAVNIILIPNSGAGYSKTNAFAYLPTTFTDDPLTAGVTTAKAQHIIELRQAVDALRAVAGLGLASWTDPALQPTSTVIKSPHIVELRTLLEDAATRLGYPAGSYTDPTLSSGFVIKQVHVEELRQRVRAVAG